MVGVADEGDEVSGVGVPARLGVHLRHERADGVDDAQAAGLAVLADGRCDAVRRQHADLPRRDVVLGVDEDRAEPLQPADDVVVVDDLVPNVDGRPVRLEQPLDDLDRAVDARAERPRGGKENPLHAALRELVSARRTSARAHDRAPTAAGERLQRAAPHA